MSKPFELSILRGDSFKKDSKGVYVEIGDRKAREKTSQALREGAPELRQKVQTSPTAMMTTTRVIFDPATTRVIEPAAVSIFHPRKFFKPDPMWMPLELTPSFRMTRWAWRVLSCKRRMLDPSEKYLTEEEEEMHSVPCRKSDIMTMATRLIEDPGSNCSSRVSWSKVIVNGSEIK